MKNLTSDLKITKTLVLVRGLPGSGKTTAAEFFASPGNPWVGSDPVFSADDFFTDKEGNYNFDINKLRFAHQNCFERTEVAMKRCRSKIFVANTFTQEKEMKNYFELAEKHGYRVITLVIENRHGNKSVHDVPEETMEKMKNRFSIKL